jgi:hypothetical protein
MMSNRNFDFRDAVNIKTKFKGIDMKKYNFFQNLYTKHVSNVVSEKMGGNVNKSRDNIKVESK